MQNFLQTHEGISIQHQTDQIYSLISAQQNEIDFIEKQIDYHEGLDTFLKKDLMDEEIVISSNLEISNSVLNSLLLDMNNMIFEYSELKSRTSKSSPALISQEMSIENLKQLIAKAIDHSKNELKHRREEAEHSLSELKNKLLTLPKYNREYETLERKYSITENLYSILLTKRAELEITKTSNVPINEILDSAENHHYQLITPIKAKIFRKSIAYCLIIAGAIIAMLLFFNDKVFSNEDIEAITQFPIVGHILHNKYKSYTVVNKKPQSLVSESFRSLRSNYDYQSKEKETSKIILVTSNNIEEGKGFVALNLATCYAQKKCKTILVGCDLRKPSLGKHIKKLEKKRGLSLFYKDENELHEIIQNTEDENLDVIYSGPVPSNPSELMSKKKKNLELFNHLKSEYDVIVLDTSPIGRVSDTLSLVDFADLILLVVRHNKTRVRDFIQLSKDFKRRDINNCSIVINDIQVKPNRYGYGPGYGYGYGYSVN